MPLIVGLNDLKGLFQSRWCYDSMTFFTLSLHLSIKPGNEFLFSLQMVMTMTRTPLPSECSRDVWKDQYPFSCLGTLSGLCLCSVLACREVATHTKTPHSVLSLCNHCKALLDAAVRAHREPEHFSTAQQWYLTQTTESTNPAAQTSLSHQPAGYELFTGNPEINSSQESCSYSQTICKLQKGKIYSIFTCFEVNLS